MIAHAWLPPHTVRISNRAKQVNLKICPYYGLEIILPVAFNGEFLSIFLEKHRGWIERSYKRVKPFIRERHEPSMPEHIIFPAMDVHWAVSFILGEPNKLSVCSVHENQLTVSGNLSDKKRFRQAMNVWLKSEAKKHLIPWLHRVSAAVEMPFARAKICHAKSLWGSCSIKKDIALNCRLLFLSPALVEYVILHELCHTIHFNHSKQFWDLLKQLSPNCLALRKELRYANRHVPIWVLER